MKRYALLDTDFISKTHSVQDDGGNHLIDRVMELPGYEFFCHAQIVTELNRYNADAPIWLSEKIGAQKIKSYTDQKILESLSLVRGPLACATYTQMLKLACDAFSRDYFSEHYRALEDADYATISNEDYLKELQLLDVEVGKKNNLGEMQNSGRQPQKNRKFSPGMSAGAAFRRRSTRRMRTGQRSMRN